MPDFTAVGRRLHRRRRAACTSRSASANERQPAKWTAVYSPSERPAVGPHVRSASPRSRSDRDHGGATS